MMGKSTEYEHNKTEHLPIGYDVTKCVVGRSIKQGFERNKGLEFR